MSVDWMLRVIAALVPGPVRERYLEEWRADAESAHELGMRRGSVIGGALSVAARLDWAHTGEPRGAGTRRLARRGMALVIAMSLVALWRFWNGGALIPVDPGVAPGIVSMFRILDTLLTVLSYAAVAVGVVYIVGAAIVARTVLGRATLMAAAVGPATVASVAVVDGSEVLMAAGLALSGVAYLAAIILAGLGMPSLVLERRSAPHGSRTLAAVAGVVLLSAILAIGAMDVLVWNPQAKVPGLTIEQIYARMEAFDTFEPQSSYIAVALWAAIWLGLAIAVGVIASRVKSAWLTPRRLAILFLGMGGSAMVFKFFAGFGIGMTIADTFGLSGGDVSLVSAGYFALGPMAIAAAIILLGWAPRAEHHPGREAAAA